tara:strand:- start:12231 stop:12332 length:102 start_codon:yes stop_codon:yes gene_type:complete
MSKLLVGNRDGDRTDVEIPDERMENKQQRLRKT